jgi:hypothetical protein
MQHHGMAPEGNTHAPRRAVSGSDGLMMFNSLVEEMLISLDLVVGNAVDQVLTVGSTQLRIHIQQLLLKAEEVGRDIFNKLGRLRNVLVPIIFILVAVFS